MGDALFSWVARDLPLNEGTEYCPDHEEVFRGGPSRWEKACERSSLLNKGLCEGEYSQ